MGKLTGSAGFDRATFTSKHHGLIRLATAGDEIAKDKYMYLEIGSAGQFEHEYFE